jgi:hypothetical protein
VMMQLGVLGLVYTYRHPALRDQELSAADNPDGSRNAGVSRDSRYRELR